MLLFGLAVGGPGLVLSGPAPMLLFSGAKASCRAPRSQHAKKKEERAHLYVCGGGEGEEEEGLTEVLFDNLEAGRALARFWATEHGPRVDGAAGPGRWCHQASNDTRFRLGAAARRPTGCTCKVVQITMVPTTREHTQPSRVRPPKTATLHVLQRRACARCRKGSISANNHHGRTYRLLSSSPD